jgi:hypothetical protein
MTNTDTAVAKPILNLTLLSMPLAINKTYPLHKVALAPLLPLATEEDLKQSTTAAVALGEDTFTAFLHQQGLAPLWDERIEQYDSEPPLSTETCNALHQARLMGTGEYLIQRHILAQVKEILDEAKLPHAVFKGSHTRERYYNTPSLRPAVDIDVLVHFNDKMEVINVFESKGFEFYGVPENISHEACLTKRKTTIDLHWDIFRPGRTRKPMASTLLDTRKDFGSHWGMSDEATLFMMLVHPVFAKYTTTPQAALVRLLDLVYMLEKEELHWPQVIIWLEQAGVKTCGWITLTWLEMLTGYKVGNAITDSLKPGKRRRRYLRQWLDSDRSTRLLSKPLLVQLGFTLPAHDKASDAIRALWQAQRGRKRGPQILHDMEQTIGRK